MIRAIIIDDEERSVTSLKNLLNISSMEVEVVGVAYNVEQGFDLIQRTAFEVLFLDIEMPDGTGFDLLDKVERVNFDVCFITAFNQYAIKAFRYAALDYLMKPIDFEELESALGRVRQYNVSAGNDRVNLLLENHKAESRFKKLAIATTAGVFYFDVEDIVRCEADGSYTKLFANGSKSVMASKSIKEYEGLLPNYFCRVHKSHLVNFNYIKQFMSGESPQLILKDESIVAVSRRRKQLVTDKLDTFR